MGLGEEHLLDLPAVEDGVPHADGRAVVEDELVEPLFLDVVEEARTRVPRALGEAFRDGRVGHVSNAQAVPALLENLDLRSSNRRRRRSWKSGGGKNIGF